MDYIYIFLPSFQNLSFNPGCNLKLLSLSHTQEAWRHAIQKAKQMPDPWAEFHLEDIETEPAIRHRSVSALATLSDISAL